MDWWWISALALLGLLGLLLSGLYFDPSTRWGSLVRSGLGGATVAGLFAVGITPAALGVVEEAKTAREKEVAVWSGIVQSVDNLALLALEIRSLQSEIMNFYDFGEGREEIALAKSLFGRIGKIELDRKALSEKVRVSGRLKSIDKDCRNVPGKYERLLLLLEGCRGKDESGNEIYHSGMYNYALDRLYNGINNIQVRIHRIESDIEIDPGSFNAKMQIGGTQILEVIESIEKEVQLNKEDEEEFLEGVWVRNEKCQAEMDNITFSKLDRVGLTPPADIPPSQYLKQTSGLPQELELLRTLYHSFCHRLAYEELLAEALIITTREGQ